MWQWLVHAYTSRIVRTGRQPLFLLLTGLVGSFVFIRFSVRMIRRGVRWWPGNVAPGGLHIHHVVFGQAMMLLGGVGAFTIRPDSSLARNVLAVVFGVGCGLVLDEFALVLHLEDVYWSEEGRKSVDAVILTVAMIVMLLLGWVPFTGFTGPQAVSNLSTVAVLLVFVVICLLKGKVWTGLLGVPLPPLAVIGAIRLARPTSPWARWRYYSRPRRLARAERRDARLHRRLDAVRTRLYDALAGAPHLERPQVRAAEMVRKALPTRPSTADLGPSRLERWVRPLSSPCATAVVWYLRLAATFDVVAGLIAPFRNRVHRANSGDFFTPFLVTAGFTAAALAALLAVMLRRRKRAAWIVALVLSTGNAALYWLALGVVPEVRAHPFNWASAGLTTAVPLALLIAEPVCRVRGERGNIARGLAYLVLGGVVAAGLGTVLVHQTDHPPTADWAACFRYAVLRIFTVSMLVDLPEISVPGWTDLLINVISVAFFLQVLRAFFRSPRGRARLLPEDELRLRTLLDEFGDLDSLGYFALRHDKSACWSAAYDAAVLYRVANGVAMACGDPVGDPRGWPQAIETWLKVARTHAWVPAVTGASEAAAAAYERYGLKVLAFGDEAVVGAAGFSLDGDAIRPLRRAHEVIRAAGYTVVVRRHRDIPGPEMAHLVHLADAWRHGTSDRLFTMALGRLGAAADGDCVLVECRDPNDRTCALLSLVPWGRTGLTLDLMRRDRESSGELVPYMIAELLLRARSEAAPVAGLERVSLNFTVFHTAAEHGGPGTGWVFRVHRGIVQLLARKRRLESVQRVNAVFHPRWQPRYLLYERATELPRIAVANAATEGFLTTPRLGRGTLPG
ncbi:phosphatidylglycerol lysyltransferase domain-containing protein [Streptomyces silvisoli]|uniref:Phosphatidylglycerol lysyltransferase domain-containing protein n=1 Tax=Streptomyces silvisoli TaxID=3034235 RepID=A0ABT5ZH32_9ACTN|nr:phosphatidylglycerol lysyltransferase domain-containing protein [Streptomyces silvisoli]MDF3288308.1 phosphatidylglycerol lysyltransferase domain-containing protein [Streptomyces silvisoli]